LVCLPFWRALAAVSVWGIAGISLFWAGWPWLWYDTWARFAAFWGTGIARATIWVQYFGQVFADRDVPWHYPWFYFVTTVPIGLQALGLVGLARGWMDRRSTRFPLLLGGTILLFLGLFSTRIAVYDQERLFLHVFPAWALLIGLGFGWLWDRWFATSGRRVILSGFLLVQGVGVVVMDPFGLSYYNALVGGLHGAARLGLERTYYSDAVDQVLLDRLASEARPGASAAMVPTLYPGQGVLTTGYNRTLARREIILQDDVAATRAEWVVLSHRTAYWRPDLVNRLARGGGHRVASRSRLGIELSALWHFPSTQAEGPGSQDHQSMPDAIHP
jgi:hypothetical protein